MTADEPQTWYFILLEEPLKKRKKSSISRIENVEMLLEDFFVLMKGKGGRTKLGEDITKNNEFLWPGNHWFPIISH